MSTLCLTKSVKPTNIYSHKPKKIIYVNRIFLTRYTCTHTHMHACMHTRTHTQMHMPAYTHKCESTARVIKWGRGGGVGKCERRQNFKSVVLFEMLSCCVTVSV